MTMTARNVINRMLLKTEKKSFQGNKWGAGHVAAWRKPIGFEVPVVRLIEAIAMYADSHAARYDDPIGDDYVIGASWLDMISAVIGLLNGETGRLDCACLNGLLRDIAKSQNADLGEV